MTTFKPLTNTINTMNKDIYFDEPASQLTEVAREVAHRASDAAKEVAERTTLSAKELYQSAAVKAEDTLAISKEYVRRNPLPVLLGAVAVGAALGYMVMMSRRKPTFGERYADEPMVAVREAILGALAPVTQRVHNGYDSALDGAGKAMDRIHRFSSGRAAHSFSDRLGRIGENLKFW
jgi:ElaB/YqjD/DUF883 family membrane-anchored ribosome-binding protein